MKPDISEFSYGYALTEALIWDTSLPVVGAPIFPSLIQEGRSGGYDVAISFSGILLFLQFKLSHYMVRGTAYERQQGILDVPFYRMHLRPARHSRQHSMLLDLESTGEAVLYAAPKFYLPSELSTAYLSRRMIQRSLFVRPSSIGQLPDEWEHYISFREGYPVYLCSEPKQIRDKENSETSLKELYDILERYEPKQYNDEVINDISDHMHSIILKHQKSLVHPMLKAGHEHALSNMKPVEKLKYLSKTYFDCEPIIVNKRYKE